MEVEEAKEVEVSLEAILPGAILEAKADAAVRLPGLPAGLIYQWPGPVTPISP